MPTKYLGVIPNKEFELPSGIPISFGCGIKILRFTGGHYAELFRFDQAEMENVSVNHHYLVCDEEKLNIKEKDVGNLSSALCFTLNFFSKFGHISYPSFYACEGKVKLRPKKKHLSAKSLLPPTYDVKFQFQEKATSEVLEPLFVAALRGIEKDKAISVTFERYILALARPEVESKIVDLAICLESLLPFESEISFRFSLFGAIFSSNDLERRKEIYTLLRNLYTSRSKIVHGSPGFDKSILKLEGQWDTLFEIARYSILYKLNFLNSNPSRDWQSHLDEVVLGAAA